MSVLCNAQADNHCYHQTVDDISPIFFLALLIEYASSDNTKCWTFVLRGNMYEQEFLKKSRVSFWEKCVKLTNRPFVTLCLILNHTLKIQSTALKKVTVRLMSLSDPMVLIFKNMLYTNRNLFLYFEFSELTFETHSCLSFFLYSECSNLNSALTFTNLRMRLFSKQIIIKL